MNTIYTRDLESLGRVTEEVSQDELAAKVENALARGVVVFSYEKKGGVLRPAIGTRNPDYIPNTRLTDEVVKELESATDNLIANMVKCINDPDIAKADPEGLKFGIEILHGARVEAFGDPESTVKDYKTNEEYLRYYDFESKGWRQCKKTNLVTLY